MTCIIGIIFQKIAPNLRDSCLFQISPKGADEFKVDLTFIMVGGPLGYRGRNMFDIAKDSSIIFKEQPNVSVFALENISKRVNRAVAKSTTS